MRFRSFSYIHFSKWTIGWHFSDGTFPCQLSSWTASLICINSLALLGFLNFNACFKWTCTSGPETPPGLPPIPEMVVKSCLKMYMVSHIQVLLILAVRNRKLNTTSKADGGLFSSLHRGLGAKWVQIHTLKLLLFYWNSGSARAHTFLPEFTVNCPFGSKSL